MKLGQNVCCDEILEESENGSCWSLTRSSGEIKPCVRSRGHIFCLILMKLGQNVCRNEISHRFEIWSF